MKKIFPIIVLLALSACRGGDVLIEKAEDTRKYENLPYFTDVPDSTKLKISTAGPWAISIAKGGEWCSVSHVKGNTKTDSVVTVYVAENPTSQERTTSLILSSGTSNVIYKISQRAGQLWYDTPYWERTDVQKNGMRGQVKSIQEIRVGTRTANYEFDKAGNVVKAEYAPKAEEGKGYITDSYVFREFDKNGHLLRYEKDSKADTTVIEYEYANKGKLVASGSYILTEPSLDILDQKNIFVPDLSAMHQTLKAGKLFSTSDFKYFFQNEKLYIEKDVKMYMDTTLIISTLDTACWEYRNGKPYNCETVTNIVYADNDMFMVVDYMGYRYRFEENSRNLIVKSIEDQGYMPREVGDVMKNLYTINEFHDWASGSVTVKGKEQTYTEHYSPFYDHNTNWTTTDWTFYDTEYHAMTQKSITRHIAYYTE